MNEWNTYDVVVIGGGLAGLTATAYLARNGKSVALLEQSSRIGGRAASFVKDGFHFNQGPHALYRGAEGINILRELGVPFDGKPPEGAGRYLSYLGQLHPVPITPEEILATPAFSPAARQEILGFFGRLGTENLDHWNGISWQTWLEQEVKQPEAREFIAAMARLSNYANAPALQSAGATLKQLQIGNGGVLYLDGGWQTLVEGLRQAAETAGAVIIPQTTVKNLAHEDDWWLAEHGQENISRARTVVMAGNPATVGALLKQQYPDVSSLTNGLTPVHAACLDVALQHLPKPARFALGIDRPLYYSLHSAWAKLAPTGTHLLQVAKYLPAGSGQTASSLEAELEAWLEELQPGWQQHVIQRRFLPKIAVTQAVVTAGMHGLIGRPGPAIPGLPGAYIAGDWVGSTGMLADASLASAKQAAQMILEKYPVAATV